MVKKLILCTALIMPLGVANTGCELFQGISAPTAKDFESISAQYVYEAKLYTFAVDKINNAVKMNIIKEETFLEKIFPVIEDGNVWLNFLESAARAERGGQYIELSEKAMLAEKVKAFTDSLEKLFAEAVVEARQDPQFQTEQE